MTTSNDILTEARSWIGTRFHHQGRVKKTAAHSGGCDCLGLVVGVASALQLRAKNGGFITNSDRFDYGRAPDGATLQTSLEACLFAVPLVEIQPADVLLLRFEKEPQHVGLMGEGTLIHCYAAARKVVEHRLDALWHNRIVAAYRFPQLTNQ